MSFTNSSGRPFRFAIMGAGHIAGKFTEAARLAGAEVAAVASKSRERAEAFATAHDIPSFYDSYAQMLAEIRPDCVYIATTPHQHFALSALCLDHRTPVLCEKAMFLSHQDAACIFSRSEAEGIFVMEAMWSKFLPALKQVKAWMDGGRIGRVTLVDFGIGFAAPGAPERVKAVADACRSHGIPIRIGVNGGSLKKPLLRKYGGVTAEALVESAFGHVALLNRFDFDDICISVKCSSVPVTMQAYRLLHERCEYPLHLGVTEAGTPHMGILKSAMGIGGLLCLGIGDTFRVTLTADPVEEIAVAKDLLRAAGLRHDGVNLIACPTCGRTKINLIPIAQEVEQRLKDCKKNITVAVMGCVVNGPGEASAADVGIAGGDGYGLIFRKGQALYKVPQERLVEALMEEIEKL